jgi:hypothetical protein
MNSNLRFYDQDFDEEGNSRSKAELPSLRKSSKNPPRDFHQKIDDFLELNNPEGKSII